jgi:hypothetical protein
MNLLEGGNVFKDPDGNPVTVRINQSDVKPTVAWLEQLTGLPLLDNMLGSTGQKPTSGDLDLAVDKQAVGKEVLEKKLADWATSHGEDPKDWVRKTGTSVHFKTPITGRPDRGYVQTDFMFLEKPSFSKFILRQDPDSEYKGATRNVLINSIAKSMGYKLNQIAGIMNRATNELITDDPDQIAKMLLNRTASVSDLGSVEKILRKLKTDSQRQAKLADFVDHMQRAGTPIKETVDTANPYSVHWLARLRDRIVNHGMQVIVENEILEEGVRIEHPEDLVFRQGSRGIVSALEGIKRSAENPQETTTIKWDGKPAIIFGRKPNGEFVLTDKGGFLKKDGSGLANSAQQMADVLAQRRGGGREELAALYAKLFPLLRQAVPQNFRGYIQGDLVFSSTPELRNGNYVFTPNTVTYRVNADSDIGKKIGRSKVGVVIHSRLAEPGASAEPIRSAALNDVDGLLILDPSLKETRTVNINKNLFSEAQTLYNKYSGWIDTLFAPEELRNRRISDLPDLMNQYINSRVRSGSYTNLVRDFGPWIESKSPTKAPRIIDWMNTNKQGVAALFQAFLTISALKNDLVRQLDAGGHEIEASINNEPGHEGYVGADMKFVDRMRFSQANFAKNNPGLA